MTIGVSIHAFREEGDYLRLSSQASGTVSIHAFREEGDEAAAPQGRSDCRVSIHAFREEGDVCLILPESGFGVSIHAFREEGDGYERGTYVA